MAQRPTTPSTQHPAPSTPLLALLLGLVLVAAVLWSLAVTAVGSEARSGWSALREGRYSEAVRRFENALNTGSDARGAGYDQALTQLGLSYSYLAQRDMARAGAVLPAGGTLGPWIELQRGLVWAFAGDSDRAKAIWGNLLAKGDLPAEVQRSALWHTAQAEWPQTGDHLSILAALPAANDPYVASANVRMAQALAASDEAAALAYLRVAAATMPTATVAVAAPNMRLGPTLSEGLPIPAMQATMARLAADLPEAERLRAAGTSAASLDAFWGRSFVQQEEWALARALLLSSLAAAPDVADVHSYLGLTLQRLGDNEGAERELLRAVALQPERTLGQHLLARFLMEQERTDEALPHLEAALRSEPNSVVLHLDIAAWYEARGSYLEAEGEYTQAETLQNAFGTASELNSSLALANFYLQRNFELGGCELSREAARRAVTRNAGADEYDALGWAEYSCRNNAQAIAALRQALTLNPDSPRAHYHLGMMLKETGNRQAGRRELELAQDLDPGGLWARRALAAIVTP